MCRIMIVSPFFVFFFCLVKFMHIINEKRAYTAHRWSLALGQFCHIFVLKPEGTQYYDISCTFVFLCLFVFLFFCQFCSLLTLNFSVVTLKMPCWVFFSSFPTHNLNPLFHNKTFVFPVASNASKWLSCKTHSSFFFSEQSWAGFYS